MSDQEENMFGGFNLLKGEVPEKPKKEDKKEPEAKKEVKEEKQEDNIDAFSEAEQKAKEEVDKMLAEKNKKAKKEEETKVEEEPTTEEEEEEDDNEASLLPFVQHLSSKGIIEFDPEKDQFEDSEEGLEKLMEKTVTSKVTEWKQSYPEDAQKFLQFIEDGGNPADFHKLYYAQASFEDYKIDPEDTNSLKHLIKEGLIAAGWEDKDEIEDEISLYEDAGKLETKAKAHLSRLQKLEKENKQMILDAQAKFAEEQKLKQKEEFDNFKKGLYDKDEISGFKFDKKMKDELWSYMTKPIDKKTGITEYQKDSQEKGQEARYIFAYLMKNNWDYTKLSKDLKNKVVSDVKRSLNKYTDSRKKVSKGQHMEKEKELEDKGFGAFREYLG